MVVEVITLVIVVVETSVNVEVEVVVCTFTLPARYPAPALASIATTSREAITPFLMPQRVASWGV